MRLKITRYFSNFNKLFKKTKFDTINTNINEANKQIV